MRILGGMREAGLEPGSSRRLCDILQSRLPDILNRWERAVRLLQPARELSGRVLRDHLPQLLDRIARALRTVREGDSTNLDEYPDVHALDRLDAGFDLETVIREFAILRKVILEVWAEQVGPQLPLPELARLNEALDDVVTASVSRFAEARDRTLKALDRISAAALGKGDLDTFLPELIQALQKTTPACDTVTILLRDRDGDLRVRATVGLEPELSANYRVPVGEGFAGTIAATGRPLMLRHASRDPLVRSQHIREKRIRALYGIPLEHAGEVIGVAHFGSLTAFEFSLDDQQLFRAMARRATSLIIQTQLMDREREARQEAQRALALLDTLLSASPVGIAFLDPALRYARINASLAAVNGSPVEAHLGHSVREVLPEQAPLLEPPLRRVLETGQPVLNVEFTGAPPSTPGEMRSFLGNYYPVKTADGWVLGIGGVVTEVTGLKRAQEELRQAVELKDTFIGIVGHDLRNPLLAVKATAELMLRQAEGNDGLQRSARRILNATDRMARMIDDVLDFVRGRLGGGIPVHRQTMDMAQVCTAAVEEVRATHPGREIRLHVEGDPRGQWDPDRVAQVIGNLLGNAVKHGAPDAPIQVAVRGGEGQVDLEVHNEGAPIPQDLRENLFQPFRQGRGRGHGGLGLGLFIVDRIVSAHGGAINVRSAQGEGTTFTVTWPRAAV
jgi:nitrogen-specific signal transduction histidine kinase